MLISVNNNISILFYQSMTSSKMHGVECWEFVKLLTLFKFISAITSFGEVFSRFTFNKFWSIITIYVILFDLSFFRIFWSCLLKIDFVNFKIYKIPQFAFSIGWLLYICVIPSLNGFAFAGLISFLLNVAWLWGPEFTWSDANRFPG